MSGYLPFAYIIIPPLLWAAVRFEFKGAAATLIVLALITAVFTISSASQFAGDPESQTQKQIMLQLFLATSAFSALIVAVISRQHQLPLLTLRDRERELSQLVDMVPSQVWPLTPDGKPTFYNKRLVDFLGLDVTALDKAGMSRLAAAITALVHPDDRASLAEAMSYSLANGERFSMRFRQRRADGVYRWLESRAEPLRDSDPQEIADNAPRRCMWWILVPAPRSTFARGACARGCRLDERGLIDAEPTILAAIAEGIDLVINRFGRAESLGRGLLGCFTAAMEAGVRALRDRPNTTVINSSCKYHYKHI